MSDIEGTLHPFFKGRYNKNVSTAIDIYMSCENDLIKSKLLHRISFYGNKTASNIRNYFYNLESLNLLMYAIEDMEEEIALNVSLYKKIYI